MQEESCVIPHTIANEELVLSLLDRFIDVTNISFGALADKFYQYVPDELENLKYHGRQISFYMKRERPISPNHWHGIAEFVFSDEFVETLPEVRIVLRQQESTIEAGVYFTKLNGLVDKDSKGGSLPEKCSGFWIEGTSQVYIQSIEGYPFGIIHGNSILAPAIFSGFIFPAQKSCEELKKLMPALKSCGNVSDIFYIVYLWDRLSRRKLLCEIYPLVFNPNRVGFFSSLTFNPYDLENYSDQITLEPLVSGDETVKSSDDPHFDYGRKDRQIGYIFHGESLELKPDETSEGVQYFVNFIDNNLWGVLGDGANS